MATSRQALRQRLATDLGAYWSGAATGGATTNLVDSSSDSPFVDYQDDQTFRERFVVLVSGTAANVGHARRIRGYDGYAHRISWPLALPAVVASGDGYEVYAHAPARLNTWINRALERLTYRTRVLLTLVPDGDMEASGTTSWTASGAALSKTTVADYILTGARALRVANSGAGGYAQSTAIPVVPGETVSYLAPFLGLVGTAAFTLQDVTNGVAIASHTGAAGAYRAFRGQATVPATCRSVAVRLGGSEASADTLWDSVQLLRTHSHRLPLPSWVTGAGQIQELEILPYGGGESGDFFRLDELIGRPVRDYAVFVDPAAATPGRIEWRGWLAGAGLLYATGIRNYEALAADADTTPADPRWVIAGARRAMAAELAVATGAEDSRRWQVEEQKAGQELTALTAKRRPRGRWPIRLRGYP